MRMLSKFVLGVKLASVSAGALAVSSPALASAPTVEGNVSIVSDYRFRGVSLSDETIALQGGLDAGWESGFYVGTWGSSIEPVGNSELELDLYAGFSSETASGIGYDIGVLVYTYPGASDTEYLEIYGSLSKTLGPIAHSVGVAWAPEQDNIGGDDNLYLYYSGEAPLGGVEGLTAVFGVGWESGVFGDPDGDGDDKVDFTLGLVLSRLGLDFGLTYVDTTEDTPGSDSQLVLSVGRAF
ncbi:MAG: TorF family putative porin [Alphaproteobacteria bacterium]|nr:TorF family putative porin [Alphaproteobacteria bacterium]